MCSVPGSDWRISASAFWGAVRGLLGAACIAAPMIAGIATAQAGSAPAFSNPPPVSWTGIYLGLNGGFGFGTSAWSDRVTGGSTGTFTTSGFVFGGTLGGNDQIGALVFGIEADGAWSDLGGSGTFTTAALCAGGCRTTNTWLTTVRGRLGYAFDTILVYGTGGVAFGDVRANFSNDAISGAIETGWTAGAGVEVAFAPNWTAKFEYLFVDLANGACTTDCVIQNPAGPPIIPNIAVKFDESIARAGINYRFGW